MLEQLKKYIRDTNPEEIKSEWRKIEQIGFRGPSVFNEIKNRNMKKQNKNEDILYYPPGYGVMFSIAKALQESKAGKTGKKKGKKDKTK